MQAFSLHFRLILQLHRLRTMLKVLDNQATGPYFWQRCSNRLLHFLRFWPSLLPMSQMERTHVGKAAGLGCCG